MPTEETQPEEPQFDYRKFETKLISVERLDKMADAAFGAAAKGTIMLNYVGLGPDLVQDVVDRNVHKHGRYVPGVRLPIHGPEMLLTDQPDYLVILPWNLTEEIAAQQETFRGGGGRFIVPIPEPRII